MAKRKYDGTTCDCIEQLAPQLEEHNTRICTEILLNFRTGKSKRSGMIVKTEKIDSKKKEPAKTIFAKYCPCCGKLQTKD